MSSRELGFTVTMRNVTDNDGRVCVHEVTDSDSEPGISAQGSAIAFCVTDMEFPRPFALLAEVLCELYELQNRECTLAERGIIDAAFAVVSAWEEHDKTPDSRATSP